MIFYLINKIMTIFYNNQRNNIKNKQKNNNQEEVHFYRNIIIKEWMNINIYLQLSYIK